MALAPRLCALAAAEQSRGHRHQRRIENRVRHRRQVFRHDVTSEAEWVAAVAFAKSTFGGLDILVNNAGIFLTKPTRQTTLEEFRRVMQVTAEGVFLDYTLSPAIAERAKKWDGGGSVVNLSSVSGIVGQANTLAYNASKGAVRLMTKSSAIECARAKLKVRVNSVHPGIIDTPMIDQFAAVLSERTGQGSNSIRERFVENHPMGRLGRDIDIANAITFLASDKAVHDRVRSSSWMAADRDLSNSHFRWSGKSV